MTKKLTEGIVTIEVPDDLVPPEDAGKKSLDELNALMKARAGAGTTAKAAAAAMELLGARFSVPGDLTPAMLRDAAEKSDGADIILRNIDLLRARFQQANLIWDSQCAELLGRVNDQVKAQGKHDESIRLAFTAVTEYFANKKPEPKK